MDNKIVIDNFLGGISPSPFFGDPKTQCDPNTVGFDANIPGQVGILQRGFASATIANVSILGGSPKLRKMTMQSGNPYLYMLGQDINAVVNKLYKVDCQSHTILNASPWPHTLPGGLNIGLGMELFGGYLYYASDRYLGRYDLSITFNDSFNVSLTSVAMGGGNVDHPMAAGNGYLFIGNLNVSGMAVISSVDSSDIVNLTKLDLTKTGQFVKALEFADNNLYIGMSFDKDNSTNFGVESFLYLWDTVSSSWQQRFRFPQGNISCIRYTPRGIFVFGRKAVMRFTGSGFEPIYQQYTGGPDVHGSDFNANGVLFWKTNSSINGSSCILSFGSVHPKIPDAVNCPLINTGAESGFIKWIDDSNIYVSGFSSGALLQRFQNGGSNGYSFSAILAEWRTPMIQFPNRSRFTRITLYTLPVTDSNLSVDIYWVNQAGTNQVKIGTLSQAYGSDNNYSKFQFALDGYSDYAWQIRLVHTLGGSPQIRRIEIEYEIEKE